MQIIDKYNGLVRQREFLRQEKRKSQRKIKKLSEEIQNYKDTRTILNKAIRLVHQKFKLEIESVVTRSIQSIFNRNFTFKLHYEEKRNGIESKTVIKEDGQELNPKDEMGGSIVDVISFSFRIILWWLSSPRSRNTFILDEPFKNMGQYSILAANILKELSDTLKFQVIMITHDNNIKSVADKLFHVKHNGIKSMIVTRKIN